MVDKAAAAHMNKLAHVTVIAFYCGCVLAGGCANDCGCPFDSACALDAGFP